MNAAADPISTFNEQLAHAKLAALEMLRHLMSTVAAFNAEDHPQTSNWPGEGGRELRLIAATILRTKPLAAEPATPRPLAPPPEAPPTVDRASGPERGDPKDQAPTATPKLRSRLNPVAIRARRDIRNLVRDGVLPASFLEGIDPPPPSRSPPPGALAASGP
jgi:hypothetical protein